MMAERLGYDTNRAVLNLSTNINFYICVVIKKDD